MKTFQSEPLGINPCRKGTSGATWNIKIQSIVGSSADHFHQVFNSAPSRNNPIFHALLRPRLALCFGLEWFSFLLFQTVKGKGDRGEREAVPKTCQGWEHSTGRGRSRIRLCPNSTTLHVFPEGRSSNIDFHPQVSHIPGIFSFTKKSGSYQPLV